MDNRISIFYPAKNEAGYVQAVIPDSDYKFYKEIGFVKTIDDLNPVEDLPKDDEGDKKPEEDKAPPADTQDLTESKADKKGK
ncbi:hypothetical protein ACTUSX_11330 [Pantoea ananatis]|uniref:hypothetical protein n=1 Tax=Pantoea ananas TaxID=553 RepID=UPI003FA4453D